MDPVVHGSQSTDNFDDLIRQVESLRLSIEQQAKRSKRSTAGVAAWASPKRGESAALPGFEGP